MSVVDLGNKAQFANSQTITLNPLLAGVSAGTLVVVFVHDNNSSIAGATVTDTKGNTYIQGVASTSGILSQIWYSFLTTALLTSDTITYTGNAGFTSQTMYISACSATGYNAIDAATTNNANGFGATFSVTGAGTAAVTNEINFALVMAFNTPTVTSSGWNVNPPSAPASTAFIPSYQINSGTSPLTYAGTLTAQNWTAMIISFKPAAGGAVESRAFQNSILSILQW